MLQWNKDFNSQCSNIRHEVRKVIEQPYMDYWQLSSNDFNILSINKTIQFDEFTMVVLFNNFTHLNSYMWALKAGVLVLS